MAILAVIACILFVAAAYYRWQLTLARRLADTDARTGLGNVRRFEYALEREVARAHRYQRELALLLFDLDDFKRINDEEGHPVADGALVQVGACLRENLRVTDIPCRVGGDEFTVIFPESDAVEAQKAFRRLGEACRSLSAGVAVLRRGEDAKDLVRRADDALRTAKRNGKASIYVDLAEVEANTGESVTALWREARNLIESQELSSPPPGPGWRRVGGDWRYSEAWLDD